MKAPSNGFSSNLEGEKRNINSELWHACAGPLVSLPPVGSLVVYFPQGHSEQVAASMQKETDFVPSYPSLPSKLICILHNVTLNADAETDEVYAQMTLQPVNKYDREALLASDMGLKHSKQPAEFFCKTLTASDTSTHGGFSVPRRAAEKIFPPLDYSMQPPAQELVAKDLHDAAWTFRHIFRGQPKRHLLTTGWSVFVSTKRLFAGDSVLFIRDEKSQLLLGIRRANRQQSTLSSSVLSSDSMHIGVLAAAAHAAANNSPFTVFYNPRASPSEFVIPLAKYQKSMYTQVSLGMRFRMMFETEDSGVRRYMGTITGISDLDSSHWKNSQWRNLQVGWDESTTGERRTRVSVWEIEPVATPFYICPPPFYRPKLPRQPGMPDDESEIENAFKRAMPWLGDDLGIKDPHNSLFPGLNLVQWMSMQQQQNSRMMGVGTQSGFYPSALATPLPSNPSIDPSKILNFQAHSSFPVSTSHFSVPKPNQPTQQLDQPPQPSLAWPHQQQQPRQPSAISPQPAQPPPQSSLTSVSFIEQDQQRKQQYFANQSLLQPQIQNQNLQQSLPQSQLPQQRFITPNSQLQQNIHHPNQVSVQQQNFHFQTQQLQQQEQQHQQEQQKHHHHLHQQQQSLSQGQQQQLPQVPLSEHQLRLQVLQKLQHQQKLFSQVPSQLPQQLPQTPNQNTQFHYQQQQPRQFNETQFSPIPLINQPQQFSSNNPPQENISNQPSQQVSPNCILGQAKSPLIARAHSTLTDGDAPSCSTSPSSNNCTSSSIGLPKATHQTPLLISEDMIIQPETTNNFVQEIQSKSDIRVKNELHTDKGPDQLTYGGGAAIDRLNASSSATSFYLEGSIQQNFSMPMLGLDGELQVDPRNNLLFGVNIDDLTPDTLLSRGFDSEKDLQNLLSSYNNQRDIETELSTAGISPQALGVPEMSFKPGCSVDPLISETGILNRGPWTNQQPQRMRTFTKVHKRGSVGRSIDVTRYRGYEDLTHDIACMFGIEGQLEDPYRTDWKLVYVDNEKDILLLGDDPWEEFLSCVQSIKILSSAEVQQMSLDGDLANMPIQNQACSGSDSGNV